MRVIARGWGRDHGGHELLDLGLSEGYERPKGLYVFRGGETYLFERDDGSIEIRRGPYNITLGGRYQVCITLTKSDVIELAAAALGDMPFAELAAMIAKPAVKPSEATSASIRTGRKKAARKVVRR